MLGRPWLDVLADTIDQGQDVHWLPCEGWEEDCLALPAVDEVITEGEAEITNTLAKLRKKGWSTNGRTLGAVLKHVDPRFINHDLHLQRLTKGGTRPSGEAFPGGGGLRWGGLEIRGQNGLLRVLGSFEYKDEQEQYQQVIHFANFGRIAKSKLNWSDKARALMRDRLRVQCDCPAFRYFYAYTAREKGFGLVPEKRPSNITNPGKRGGVCKHLNLVLKNLTAQSQKIASELKAHYEKPKKA